MAVTPNSIVTPQAVKSAHISQAFTANSTYTTTPTNSVLLLTAGSNGARLTKLRAIPIATVTATELQEFRSLDTGTTKKFSNAATGAAHTKVQTAAPPVVDFGYSDANPKLLAAGEQIYVAAGVSGSWAFEAEWMDY